MAKKLFAKKDGYLGPVQAVILDWAGTAVDHGCRGPVEVFTRAFQRFGISPDTGEVRAPMGKEKREHVATMLAMPRLGDLWTKEHGHAPDDNDVSAVFAAVLELMPGTLADYAQPVPGCVDAIQTLREMGIAIGSCTGYSRSMMEELLPAAAKAGFTPDCLVTSDEVPAGRPWPWMCWQNCMRLGIYPPESVIKVGDTVADIEEGLNAGHWSVAVTRTSNALGLDEEQAAKMDQELLDGKQKELADKFKKAGAHFVISSVAELPDLCASISDKLGQGLKP